MEDINHPRSGRVNRPASSSARPSSPSFSSAMSTKSSDHEDDVKVKQSGNVTEDDARSILESGAVDGDYGSQGGHIFEDPKSADYWRGVYEQASYEGRHRFDPNVTWTATEEKTLLRKVSSGAMSARCRRANGISRSTGESCYGLG
jgi:hypothetical protein